MATTTSSVADGELVAITTGTPATVPKKVWNWNESRHVDDQLAGMLTTGNDDGDPFPRTRERTGDWS